MAGIDLGDHRDNKECPRCNQSRQLLEFFSEKDQGLGYWCQICCKERSAWQSNYKSDPTKKKRKRRVAEDDECSKCFHRWEGFGKTCTKCRNNQKELYKAKTQKLRILIDGPLMESAPESHQPGSEPRVDKPENQIVLELATTMENRIPDDESLAQMFICLNEDSQQPPSHPTDAVGDFSDYSFDLLNGLEDPDAVYPITEFDVNPIDVFVHDFGLHLVEQNVQLF